MHCWLSGKESINKKESSMKHRIFPLTRMAAGLGTALAIFAVPAAADELYTSPAVGLRLGAGDNYQRAELAWESPSFWTYRFEGNGSRLDLVGELGVAYWHANGSRHPGSAW